MLQDIPTPTLREASPCVLETERLTLRRPTLADVKAIARLANDRRIAENTRRLPHPYSQDHAIEFVRAIADDRQRDRVPDRTQFRAGRHGRHRLARAGRAGTRLLARRRALGPGLWHRGRARGDRLSSSRSSTTSSCIAGARVANPTSRNILEKCGFQWTGVELHRFEALGSSTPVDCFRLSRSVWSSLKNWASSTARASDERSVVHRSCHSLRGERRMTLLTPAD